MNQQIEVYKNEALSFREQIEASIIKSEKDVSEAGDIAKLIKELRLKVEAEKNEYTQPANEIIKKARFQYDPVINFCKDLENAIKKKAGAYIIERNRQIAEKQEKIAERAMQGKIKEVTAIRQIESMPEQKKSIQSDSSRIGVAEYEDIEIVDEMAIPREYLIPDLKKIKKVVLAGVAVAGVIKIKKVRTSLY